MLEENAPSLEDPDVSSEIKALKEAKRARLYLHDLIKAQADSLRPVQATLVAPNGESCLTQLHDAQLVRGELKIQFSADLSRQPGPVNMRFRSDLGEFILEGKVLRLKQSEYSMRVTKIETLNEIRWDRLSSLRVDVRGPDGIRTARLVRITPEALWVDGLEGAVIGDHLSVTFVDGPRHLMIPVKVAGIHRAQVRAQVRGSSDMIRRDVRELTAALRERTIEILRPNSPLVR